MANGDFRLLDQHILAIKLLDGQSASDNGQWVEVPAFYNIRSFWCDITAEVSGSPTVEIHASNALTQPANATAGVILDTLTPSKLGFCGTYSYRWIKAKKTAGGTPAAVSCVMEAARNE